MQEKERERFYLLPGQGGRAYQRKQRTFMVWSIITALLISALLVGILFLLNHHFH